VTERTIYRDIEALEMGVLPGSVSAPPGFHWAYKKSAFVGAKAWLAV